MTDALYASVFIYKNFQNPLKYAVLNVIIKRVAARKKIKEIFYECVSRNGTFCL